MFGQDYMLIFSFFQYNYNQKKNVEVKKDENTRSVYRGTE